MKLRVWWMPQIKLAAVAALALLLASGPHPLRAEEKNIEATKGDFSTDDWSIRCRIGDDENYKFCCSTVRQSVCMKTQLYNALINLGIARGKIHTEPKETPAICKVMPGDLDFPMLCEGPDDVAWLKLELMDKAIELEEGRSK